jgi:phosphoenolpyruvate-protein phosphotransferase
VGAEGVGLFRTEFLFAGRAEAPTEDEQVRAYRDVVRAMSPHTVVIRTLDVGGDKPLPYLPASAEMNPFLGERGIRYTLAHPDALREQLRALLRASVAGKLAIMLPMVSELGQIAAVRAIIEDVQQEVGGEAELGIMVEIPGTAVMAGTFARHAAFLSAGSNDLVQYGLAVDRTNQRVAALDRPLHPGVLRLLHMTVEGAHTWGRWAGICGEMAGDLLAVPLLLGLGFDELSMAPSRIPAAKALIRRLRADACRELAMEALNSETADEVEDLVRQAISV